MVELPPAVGLVTAPGIGTGLIVGNGIGFVGTGLAPGTVIVLTVGKGMRPGTGTGLGTGGAVGINVPMDVSVGL
jgi:hypothetical protein